MKSEPPSWKGLGKTLHRYTRKGSGDLWNAGYLFASCKFCRVGVVGFKARSDTFHKADRLERNGGIYWLFYGNLGREGSMLFCVSLSLFLHLNLRFSFRCQKKSLQIPVRNRCLPLRSSASPTRLAVGHVAMCHFPPQDAGCMMHEMIRAASPRPHARPHALH